MAINLTNLFTRLGGIFQDADVIITTMATPIAAADVPAALAGLKVAAERVLIDSVHEDTELPQKTVDAALRELITQMNTASASVDGTTVSASVAAASGNSGNGTIIIATADELGYTFANLRAEVITFECIGDQQSTGKSGGELWRVTGEQAAGNMERSWPDGSGINTTIFGSSGQVDDGRRVGENLLSNSRFDSVSANVPSKWSLTTGTAGTTIQEEATNVNRGAKAIKLVGTTQTALTQTLNSTASTGTLGRLAARVRYALALWARDGSVAPTAGVFRLAIKDGSNNIINSSTAAITQSLPSLSSSYAATTGSFASPALLPSGLKAVAELSTAMGGATEELIVDELLCCPMFKLGPGGPYAVVLGGSTPFVVGDKFTVTITNNNEGEFVRHFDRFFDMWGKGLHLPQNTAGGETIDDALVV